MRFWEFWVGNKPTPFDDVLVTAQVACTYSNNLNREINSIKRIISHWQY